MRLDGQRETPINRCHDERARLMFDFRPAGHVIGRLVLGLGLVMFVPTILDWYDGNGHWLVFGQSALITILAGSAMTLACANSAGSGISLRQAFVMTTGIWTILPLFGALPFVLGVTGAGFTDAVFEAMSGLTTTGATVFSGLETLPRGILLWRGLLQWFGGIGIIVVALVVLPQLRVGGMQIFRSEDVDNLGNILPRVAETSRSVAWIYLLLTVMCAVSYQWSGLGEFDAVVHAMTTVATGGFANTDASFANLGPGPEYVGMLFMLLASLPFIRYMQLFRGHAGPFIKDSQTHAFLLVATVVVALLTIWQLVTAPAGNELAFRKAAFNGISILTGTGYVSDDYGRWGGFAVSMFFLVGLIGGCAGSTSCSIKIFRYQLLFSLVVTQIRRLHSPHGVFVPKYAQRKVGEDVIASVMAFFFLFMLSLTVLAISLGMTGLDMITSMSGAVAALANIGPGLGPVIGPTGNYSGINDTAKWLLAAGMLIGRLELMVVFVLFTTEFWRR